MSPFYVMHFLTDMHIGCRQEDLPARQGRCILHGFILSLKTKKTILKTTVAVHYIQTHKYTDNIFTPILNGDSLVNEKMSFLFNRREGIT